MKTLGWTLFFVLASSLPACLLDSAEGIEVELSIRGVASTADDLSLADAWLHVSDASLVPCDEIRASRWTLRSVAHAHHGSGRSLGSHVVQIVERGEGIRDVMGVLRPAPARYCALRVEITPAALDSDGFVESMGGLAVRADGSRGGEALAVRAEGNRVIDLPFGVDGVPTALELDEQSRVASIELEVDLGRALAAVPRTGQSPEELGLDLLVELDRGLTARVVR